MSLFDYIFKSKKDRETEKLNDALLKGATVKICFSENKDFVSRHKNSWWLYKMPWITVISCILVLSISDIVLSRFHILYVVAYVGIGLMNAMYLWVLYYFVSRNIFSDPERYDWLSYSVFWIIDAILIWFMRENMLFNLS